MSTGFLHITSAIIICSLFFALMLAGSEAGFRLGRKSEASISDKTKSQVTTVEAALLGILGLLLGFTMSMAVSRFEIRKQLVLDEANAIRTSYLRARLLHAPEGSEMANLLRQYIDVRVQYGTPGYDLARRASLRTQSARLLDELWARAVDYAQKDADPARSNLLLQSLNQVFDLEAARWMAFQDPVPDTVIYVNGIVGLLAVLLVGYAFGLHGRRQIFSGCVLALAITLVFGVIIDLDRPGTGFIQVGQQSMIDLQQRR